MNNETVNKVFFKENSIENPAMQSVFLCVMCLCFLL